MWDLDQNTGPIASFRVTAAGAAVRQVNQHLDALADDLVTLMSGNARDEPNPASVMLMRRIVQTLGMRQATLRIQTRHARHLPTTAQRYRLFLGFTRRGNWSGAHSGSGTHF